MSVKELKAPINGCDVKNLIMKRIGSLSEGWSSNTALKLVDASDGDWFLVIESKLVGWTDAEAFEFFSEIPDFTIFVEIFRNLQKAQCKKMNKGRIVLDFRRGKSFLGGNKKGFIVPDLKQLHDLIY